MKGKTFCFIKEPPKQFIKAHFNFGKADANKDKFNSVFFLPVDKLGIHEWLRNFNNVKPCPIFLECCVILGRKFYEIRPVL
jgi:hypothetical protein